MSRRKTIGIRALKNELSRVLDEVADGGIEYVVTEREHPKAVLRPWREEDGLEERAVRNAEVLESILETARRVGAAAASGMSAEDVVSKQRR